jgi:hypothetical protein
MLRIVRLATTQTANLDGRVERAEVDERQALKIAAVAIRASFAQAAIVVTSHSDETVRCVAIFQIQPAEMTAVASARRATRPSSTSGTNSSSPFLLVARRNLSRDVHEQLHELTGRILPIRDCQMAVDV